MNLIESRADQADNGEKRELQPTPAANWICVQIGARDHYAVPRALSRRGSLELLLTDAWRSGTWMSAIPGVARTLGGRWDSDLSAARVHSPILAGIPLELKFSLQGTPEWNRIHSRNQWFQRWAVGRLEQSWSKGKLRDVTTCFAYSYAAKDIFAWCREHRIRCVLGQVDPGPAEWDLIRRLRKANPEWREESEPSAAYWNDWEKELQLADEVVVNSEWSKRLLWPMLPAPREPIIIPLAFERNSQVGLVRPALNNPMQMLFLGQICLRKGIHDLVEAARLLTDCPVVFDVVGDYETLPSGIPGNMKFHGRVSRADVGEFYNTADVFLLPTHSDGFALTQVEAMSHGLPVIATPHCGQVVIHGRNGWLVPAGAPKQLAELIRRLVAEPEIVTKASIEALARAAEYNLGKLADRFSAIA